MFHPVRALSCAFLCVVAVACSNEPGEATNPAAIAQSRQRLNRAERLVDIQTAEISNGSTNAPSSRVRVGDRIFFTARTSAEGTELWVSDGTSGGTRLVRDIAPGQTDSSPDLLTAVGSSLYFVAAEPGTGRELWRSDGTAGGTVLVKDAVPGMNGLNAQQLTAVGGSLFFVAWTAGEGQELWTSDGTAAGTKRVKDIFPGSDSSNPTKLTAVGSTLYFSATGSQEQGAELWTSDGTELGTRRVKELNATQWQGARIGEMGALGGLLVFAASDGVTGVELWKSDGTEAGTVQLRDLAAGSTSSDPRAFTVHDGALYFVAYEPARGRELWKTDGSVTELVKEIGPGTAFAEITSAPVAANGLLFFSANDGSATQLWKSDGTDAGTTAVTSVAGGFNAGSLVSLGDLLLFTASDATSGYELFKTDGTAPTVVVDLVPGSGSSNPQALLSGGSWALLFADDGASGSEPWRTDGSVEGTTLLRDLTLDRSSNPTSLVNFAGSVFFSASEPGGYRLWSTDGTVAGTARFSTVDLGLHDASPPWFAGTLPQLVPAGANLFFPAFDAATGVELWRTDGNGAPVLVKDIYGGATYSSPSHLSALGDQVFFSAIDPTVSTEPFVSDGTSAGTVRLADIFTAGSPNGGSSPRDFVTNGSVMLFTGLNNNGDSMLYKSGGTPATTASLGNVAGYGGLTAVGGTFFFTKGGQLWSTDGASAPSMVVDLGSDAFPANLTHVDGALYFTAGDAAGIELWKSDGSAAGTVRIADVNPGAEGSNPSRLLGWNGHVYFRAYRPDTGYELWRTDGTPDSVELVYDATPGPLSGVADLPFTSAPGAPLFFVASDGVRGNEPWGTEGTAATTAILDDIAVGPGSSNPSEIRVLGDRVLFAASDENGDRELWAIGTDELDVTPPVIQCPADVELPVEQNEPSALATWPDATATDEVTAAPQVSYSAASGTEFPLGETVVTATATDEIGNVARCSFTVRVFVPPDVTAPTILCPTDVGVTAAQGATSAEVSYPAATATDDRTATPEVAHSAGSGSAFPIGTTTVTATATDEAGNSASCTFTVEVVAPAVDPGVDPAPEEEEKGGCSAAGGGLSGSGLLVALLALARRRAG